MQDKLWLSTISVGRELVLIPYGNFAKDRWRQNAHHKSRHQGRQEVFLPRQQRFSRVTGEYIDREECNGGYVLYPDIAAYEEAVRTADERSAIRKNRRCGFLRI